ncbi:MAG: tetratricopeptide repeat protein [Rhodospirillaceae bacterium]|nr:tetratricopeptide repeat protein [Rhodospirillaceae bacterium]
MAHSLPDDLTKALQAAGAHFNAGRFAESATLADRILEYQARNPDALHISGMSRYHLGQSQDALPLLTEAIRARKSDPGIANSLALANLALGRVDDAAAALEPLARKNKLAAAGLNTLGDCRLRQGYAVKARACFEKALKLEPNSDAARVNLGEALKEAGDLQGAINHYESLVKTHPHLPSAWRNLGLALQKAERFKDSIPPLEHYLTLNPNDVSSRLSLGLGLNKTGQFEAALEKFEEALKLAPTNADAWNNRGVSFRTLGRTVDAEESYKQALIYDPKLEAARSNLAHLAHATQGIDAALVYLDEAIALNPDQAKPHMARCQALLTEGLIAQGFKDYDWRFRQSSSHGQKRHQDLPAWRGEDLAEKTILVWSEQGVGDEIVYASMIPDLISAAKHVVIQCEPRLVPLFERSFPTATVVPKTNAENGTLKKLHLDYQIAAGTVCQHLRPDLDSFNDGSSYLVCNTELKQLIFQQYRATEPDKLIIGIAWRSGRPTDAWIKTIPLVEWVPILRTINASFVSLQYGDNHQEVENATAVAGQVINTDPNIDPLKDMDNYAAQVAAMDLVISNSNTAAHLAGSLGVPTWTILPRLGSGGLPWHWFKEGSSSPWYDSMTVYRQTDWHNWNKTIAQVAADLTALLESR